MKEINIKISSKQVKAKSKPLLAKWNREMAKELQYHLELESIYKKIERKKENQKYFSYKKLIIIND